jgi:hypothetical protein
MHLMATKGKKISSSCKYEKLRRKQQSFFLTYTIFFANDDEASTTAWHRIENDITIDNCDLHFPLTWRYYIQFSFYTFTLSTQPSFTFRRFTTVRFSLLLILRLEKGGKLACFMKVIL